MNIGPASHLGQRLSALIDGELDDGERDRVLVHLAGCDSCRGEAAALRTLKRRMNALGEAAADAELTRRLMGLPGQPGTGPSAPAREVPRASPGAGGLRELRPSWYITAGAVAAVLVGVGAAAFAAGGPGAPGPKVSPAVDTYELQHDLMTGVVPAGAGRDRPQPLPQPSVSTAPRRP